MAKYIGVVTGRRILLSNADNVPVELVQNDKDTTVIDFELSKIDYVTDLSQLNVAINYANIDKDTGESVTDIYIVDKTTVEGDTLKFSWTVGSNASVYAGKCIFQLVLTLVDADGVITQQWDSTKQSIEVHASLENVNVTQPKSFVDFVTQVKKSVSDALAGGIIDDHIQQIAEQYLEEHPVQVTTDNTLSVAGTPADALATGSAVDSLKSDLVDLRTSIDVFKSEETVNTTINTNGRYWTSNKTNSWGTHNEYAITNIVLFTKGTTIAFKAYGEPGVAFFVETTSPTSLNQKTTGISLNFEQTGYLEGKYTFEADTPISFSYKTTNEFYVNIVEKTNKVVEYYGKVDDLENSINYIPMFRNIGIVGDSLSSGEIAYSDESGNHYVDRFDSSWLSIIGRNNGVNVSHYSQGGMTTKAWLENAGNKKTSLLEDDSKNAYFVALGTNDISESYPLGNVSDTSSTNSFVGYIKNIIDVVHTKSPNAVVFLVSTYNNSDNGIRYSNMISEIADLYEYCFFVDFVNHTDIYTSTGGVWSNLGHFTSLGYVKVAKIIENLLNKIVDENKNYFKFFTLNN